MKIAISFLILITGLVANASVLECTAKIKSVEQEIAISATNAVDFKAEAGEVVTGDLKLSVYRNLTGDTTILSISKKNKSAVTPYLNLSSASGYKLQAGQELSLSATVESDNYQINCSVK